MSLNPKRMVEIRVKWKRKNDLKCCKKSSSPAGCCCCSLCVVNWSNKDERMEKSHRVQLSSRGMCFSHLRPLPVLPEARAPLVGPEWCDVSTHMVNSHTSLDLLSWDCFFFGGVGCALRCLLFEWMRWDDHERRQISIIFRSHSQQVTQHMKWWWTLTFHVSISLYGEYHLNSSSAAAATARGGRMRNYNNAIEKRDFQLHRRGKKTQRNENVSRKKYKKLHNIKTFEPTNIYILMIPIYFNDTLSHGQFL